MIIDIHAHTFPPAVAPRAIDTLSRTCHADPFVDGTDDGLLASMEEAGVHLSVIQPVVTHPRQAAGVNRTAAALNRSQTRLFSFGGVHPAQEDWRETLDEIAALGLKGVKLHPFFHDVDADHPSYLRILERAGELGLIVLIHAGLDMGFPGVVRCTPAMLRRAVRSVGPVKLVAAHMGGWGCWTEVADQLADTPVLLDTAMVHKTSVRWHEGYDCDEEKGLLTPDTFMDLLRAFGPHRVLFGTDTPWTGQRESLDFIRSLPLTPEELEAVLGGNAQTLLGL